MTIFIFFVYFFLSISYAVDFNQKGHVKLQSILTSYPDDSLFQNYIDDPSSDQNIDFRLNLNIQQSAWTLQADYQLLGKHGDSVALPTNLGFTNSQIPNDDNRLMNLTKIISEDDNSIIAHRLDRLHLTFTAEQAVFRLGRQAISWGNGLIYNPMDFFNPFDPATIDKEYKTGDDMFYSQFLFENGNDLQAVWVGRRDDDGNSTSDVSSLAAKYHIFLDDYEFDFLLAEHYDNATISLGGVFNVGGSVWRSDIVSTEIDSDWINSAVLNISYSWLTMGKNMSGHIEYYRNGFGIDDGDYSPANLAQNPELISRIQRGELFSLGRNNLSALATIELTPLWLLTATLLTNLDDDSQLFQFVSQHDLEQNLQLLVAVSFPVGDDGTEFGGIETAITDTFLSVDESLFVQLAFYF